MSLFINRLYTQTHTYIYRDTACMTVLSIINSTYKSTDTSLECKFQKEEQKNVIKHLYSNFKVE